jgi:hypothetical protein
MGCLLFCRLVGSLVAWLLVTTEGLVIWGADVSLWGRGGGGWKLGVAINQERSDVRAHAPAEGSVLCVSEGRRLAQGVWDDN